jgi:thiol-disulfide isomerase/thioredoxin
MQFINQFSFLLLAGVTFVILGWFILRRGDSTTRWAALGALLLGLILSYWIFNPGPGSPYEVAELQPGADRSLPALLEFESPYCLGCMAAQPTVDQIQRQYGAELQVVQVNVLESAAEPLLAHYGFQYTPTFIFIDRSGTEIWRSVGALDPQQVADSLEAPR